MLERQGTELLRESPALQACSGGRLYLEWLDGYSDVIDPSLLQQGEASHYKR